MGRPRTVNRLDYGQFLLSSQINYTQTYLADHHDRIGHDAVNRWMKSERFTSGLLWEHAKAQIITSEDAYLVFDDTVLDKDQSRHIEMVKLQYSGNAGGLIKGIGVVNCVYVNPTLNKFWIIDYRIFAPDYEGKTKIDHMREMFDNAIIRKEIPFTTVLMDTWYATTEIMQHIHKRKKLFYCPLKSNRLVMVHCQYQSADSVEWLSCDLESGRPCRLKGLDKKVNVKLFQVVRSTTQKETIITNDRAQSSTSVVQEVVSQRWKVEQFHRELKQTTGVEKCQCRHHRAQRTHIAVAMLVWLKMTDYAHRMKSNIYQLKQGLLDEYMKQQLRSPALSFA